MHNDGHAGQCLGVSHVDQHLQSAGGAGEPVPAVRAIRDGHAVAAATTGQRDVVLFRAVQRRAVPPMRQLQNLARGDRQGQRAGQGRCPGAADVPVGRVESQDLDCEHQLRLGVEAVRHALRQLSAVDCGWVLGAGGCSESRCCCRVSDVNWTSTFGFLIQTRITGTMNGSNCNSV